MLLRSATINVFFQKVVCLSVLVTTLVTAQTSVKITGRVVDAATNQALAGANVQVSGSARGAATNASGQFEIENLLNGHYTLSVTFMGYTPVTKQVHVTDGPPAEILFQLEPRVLETDGVQVTAERDAVPTAHVIVLSRRDVERTQATTVGDVLKHVPGIEILDAGAQGEKISIRGSRSNQVLVLLDGVALNDPMTGDVDLSAVPAHNVQKIEIHKGSASSEYGSGAIGGVINIISGSSSQEKFHVGAKSGSYGFRKIEPSASLQWRDFSMLVSLQAQHSDGAYPFTLVQADESATQQQRSNADMWSHNVYSRLGYSRNHHQFAVYYQSFSSERGNPGRIYYLTPFARSTLSRQIWGGDYLFSRHTWDVRAQVNGAKNRSESLNLRPPVSDVPFGSTPEFHFYNTFTTTQFQTQLQHHSNAWLSNKLACEYKTLHFKDRNALAPNSSPVGEADDRVFAFSFKQDYRIIQSKFRLHISPSLRYDAADVHSGPTKRSERQWSPQLGLFMAYGSGKQLYLKSTIGRAFRMPTFADLFYQDFRVQGKPDLLPEKSLNREAGLGAQFHLMGEWRLEASAFQNTIENMIVWRLGSFEFFRPYNTNVEITGEEYVLSWRTIAEHITLTGSYTHLQPLNKNDNITVYNKILPYRPQHSVKAGLDMEFSKWSTSLFYRNVGERFITEANTKSMPSYVVLDWTMSCTITVRKIKFGLEGAIYNVLDTEYQVLRDMPLPGREWRIGLSASYEQGAH
ncbi:TonB-dependent receptor plug domain-containing protein [candidate division KSB1 bacterium]|nr:TonB-dependent receptor plug domain-containing protein [candidate division KSB1 bacterium]